MPFYFSHNLVITEKYKNISNVFNSKAGICVPTRIPLTHVIILLIFLLITCFSYQFYTGQLGLFKK